jgi:hypothetical protein
MKRVEVAMRLVGLLVVGLGLAGCGGRTPAPAETAPPPEVAIYLVARDVPAAELSTADVRGLPLREPPVITTGDIVTYDAATHEIELTPEAYRRVQQLYRLPVDVDGLPFVVTVGRQPIYAGAFWSPLSSLSSDGVTIPQPMDPGGGRPVIRLNLGYPAPDFWRGGRDPRPDPRVLAALEAAGKLK